VDSNLNDNDRKPFSRLTIGLLFLIVFLWSLPFWTSVFWMRLCTEFAIVALFAAAYNIVLGQTGMFSFGHGGLFGFGAYALAVPVIKGLMPLPLAMFLGPLLTALVAGLIGWFCLRLTSGIYFSILTLAFSQLIWVTIWKLRDITGGDDGLTGIQIPSYLATPENQYFFIMSIVVISLFSIWKLANSPLGFTMKAIRENDKRASFTGINVNRYKLVAFILSGLFTGIAGVLYAFMARGAFVEFASIQKSFDPVFSVVVGGMYTFAGPIIGAGFMLALHYFIGRFTEYWPLIAGIILVLTTLYLPTGLSGGIRSLTDRIYSKKKTRADDTSLTNQ